MSRLARELRGKFFIIPSPSGPISTILTYKNLIRLILYQMCNKMMTWEQASV